MDYELVNKGRERKKTICLILFLALMPLTISFVSAHSGNDVYVRVASADPSTKDYSFTCETDFPNSDVRDWFIRPEGESEESEIQDLPAGQALDYQFQGNKFYHVGCVIVNSQNFSEQWRGDLHIDLRTSPGDPEIIVTPTSNDQAIDLAIQYSGNYQVEWKVLDASNGQVTTISTSQTTSHSVPGHGLYDYLARVTDTDTNQVYELGLPIEFFDQGNPYIPDNQGVPQGITNIWIRGEAPPSTTYEAVEPIPTIQAGISQINSSTWNLETNTTNFQFFKPVGEMAPHVDGQGHIHWYLNGIKQGRIYNSTYLISSPLNQNDQIKLTLSTNDHKEYTYQGNTISDTILVPSSQSNNSEPPSQNLTGLNIISQSGLTPEFLCKPQGSSNDLVVDWNFGDGNFIYDVSNQQSHQFNSQGDYYVQCDAWDNTNLQFTSLANFFSITDAGNSSTGTNNTNNNTNNQSNNSNPNPEAELSIISQSGLTPEFLCKPQGSSNDLVVDWNFGDGNFIYDVSNQQSHQFNSQGDYYVQCDAWDNTNLQFTSLANFFSITDAGNSSNGGTSNPQELQAPVWLSHSGTVDISPSYFHLESQQANNLSLHSSSEWQILTTSNERVWHFAQGFGALRYHVHTPDGVFENSLAGASQLNYLTDYIAQVRYKDIYGNYTEWSNRTFTTAAEPNLNQTSPTWTVPQGFSVEEFATGLDVPVQIAAAPQDLYQGLPDSQTPYLYVTELYGNVKTIYKDGSQSVYANNLLNFAPFGSITGGGQMGVIGLYVEPTTGDLYVGTVYVDEADNDSIKNKIIKFTTSQDGSTYTSQTTIIDNLPSSPSHQIQQISMNNGRLYAALGDALSPPNAQDDNILAGKIISMNPDGSDPQVYAKGFRNPFGHDWSESGVLFTTDNAPDTNDRLVKVEQGQNYGWGLNDNFASFNANRIATLNVSPVDVEFNYDSSFPSNLYGRLYVAVAGPIYQQGPTNGKEVWEFQLDPSGNVVSQRHFLKYTGTGYGTPMGLEFQEGALYFTDIYGEPGFIGLGQTEATVYRIVPGNSTQGGTQGDFRAGVSIIPWYPKDTGSSIEYIFECSGIDGSGDYLYDFYYGDGNKAINYASNTFYKQYPYGDQDYNVTCTVHDQTTSEQTSKSITINPSDFIGGG